VRRLGPKYASLTVAEISGFYFLEAESSFKPEQELVDFLAKGDAPIYIG
jgi:hypothetical protein